MTAYSHRKDKSAITGDPRIPLLQSEEMTPEQRRIYESVLSGPRGRMIGPLLAAIHVPELANRWSSLGEYLRFETCLPASLNELAILITGRRWTSQVEWWAHAIAARNAGLDSAVIDAIRGLQAPAFGSAAELEVYEFTRTLQQTGKVTDDQHAAILRRWGVRGVVELTAVVGYYTMVAMTLNAHQIPVPEPHSPLPEDDHLAELLPGTLKSGAPP